MPSMRAAVVLGDDAVLRHVDQTAGQVTRVRRLERRVGQTLAGAVRRDEVLEHREPLAEVGGDRRLDDLARRLGHQAAHAGQLANLLRRTARTRVRHDVDRVERRAAPLFAGLVVDQLFRADLRHHLFGDLLRHLRPDVDDLVVALAVGDETFGVLLLDLLDVLLRRLEQLDSCARNQQVVDADRDTRLGRVGVAQRPQLVGQKDRLLLTAGAIAAVDEITELLLAHDAVDDLERQLLRDDLVQQHAAAVVLAMISPSTRTRIAACRSSSPWS